jgi:universal stress protein E
MKALQTILVGVDFSLGSRAALHFASDLAARQGAHLHVLHVVETLVLTDLAEAMRQGREELAPQVASDARVALERFLRELPSPTELSTEVVVGSPARELLEHATALEVDLLVLGATGVGAPSGPLGTVAGRAVRKAGCRVLLAREGTAVPPRVVVAGVDFSPVSSRVIAEAVAMTAPGGRVEVLHVFQGPWHRLHYHAPTPQAAPTYREQYQRSLASRLAALAEKAKDRDVAVTWQLREAPHDGLALAAFAREVGADLLVVGTHGRSNLRDLLLGSTAERVVVDAGCSVLTVPAA